MLVVVELRLFPGVIHQLDWPKLSVFIWSDRCKTWSSFGGVICFHFEVWLMKTCFGLDRFMLVWLYRKLSCF